MEAEGDSSPEKTPAHFNQASGVFVNPWPTWNNIIFNPRFMLHHFFHRAEPHCKPKQNCPNLNCELPICKPQFQFNVQEMSIRATWLGHASVLFYIDGFHILCDPIFSSRCSISRHAFGFVRYRPSPCCISDLPPIDAVLISHNHHDHLDMPTLESIAHAHPDALWCVPIGDQDLVSKRLSRHLPKGKKPRIIQFTWWQSHRIVRGSLSLELIFTPTQHWSGRNLIRGRCKSLWGSWALIGLKHRAWFAGDTGYCKVFEEIGQNFGPFDLAALPIGSYHPRWYLKYQHVDPNEAVKIHKDIQAKHSIAIHWGTFAFTWESYLRPKEDLEAALDCAHLPRSQFRTIHHGQSFYLVRSDLNNNYFTKEE